MPFDDLTMDSTSERVQFRDQKNKKWKIESITGGPAESNAFEVKNFGSNVSGSTCDLNYIGTQLSNWFNGRTVTFNMKIDGVGLVALKAKLESPVARLRQMQFMAVQLAKSLDKLADDLARVHREVEPGQDPEASPSAAGQEADDA